MREFHAAPPIPRSYHWLDIITKEEIEYAILASYVADTANPADPVKRDGLDNYDWPYLRDDIQDWRIRIYIVWFCYLYEALHMMQRPLRALEEVLVEFKAPQILDLAGRRLATLYSGVGLADPLSTNELKNQRQKLKPHYDKAIGILQQLPKFI